MHDPTVIRVELGEEYERPKIAELFRRTLQKHDLIKENYLYHAFDGSVAIDLVYAIGCDARNPEIYSCGTAEGLLPNSNLYNPLETATLLEKPGLLVYKKRSLICVDKSTALYRFRGRNYFRALVAILLAKRPQSNPRYEIRPDF